MMNDDDVKFLNSDYTTEYSPFYKYGILAIGGLVFLFLFVMIL